MGSYDSVPAPTAQEIRLHHKGADDPPFPLWLPGGALGQQAHGVGLQPVRDAGLPLEIAADIAACGDRPGGKQVLLLSRPDVKYRLPMGRDLQGAQEVFSVLLLLDRPLPGIPLSLLLLKEPPDLRLQVVVFQRQKFGKGIGIEKLFFTRGEANGDGAVVPPRHNTLAEGAVLHSLTDQLHVIPPGAPGRAAGP